jgi:hypothetical protein
MEEVLQSFILIQEYTEQLLHVSQERVIPLIQMLQEVPEQACQVSREQPETRQPLPIYVEDKPQEFRNKG